MLTHIQEELDTRIFGERFVVLRFPHGVAQVRPDPTM
ncbi:hypothetical protein FHX74_001658 [Friedmanniella endophytica]|uniref:Uncharacterized protein n=1 Tax=Microlunatus kandeliicorticis TaxID=1759536 RepID=A0A7W3P5L3_9ACTN|nr:hypothetical protein [Microlunatus kandeliicorticis]